MRASHVVLASAVLAAAAATAALPHRTAAAAEPPPIVVVIFDELPTASLMTAQQRINEARFPAFARLAREATWYRNATTVADNTLAAVPAILTGRRPGLVDPTPPAPSQNLFTLAGATHRIHAVEPYTGLCPPGVCDHATRARASALPPVTGDTVAARRLRTGLRLVRGIRGGGAPPLYFLHLVLPHVPWQYLPSGHRYPVEGRMLPGIRGKIWGADGFRLRQAMQRHLLQVGFADRILGEVTASLRRSGLWDRAMVFVTSDHGMSIRPRGNRRRVGPQNFADIAGVPLFVKLPGRGEGRISDAPVRTIDILPTISRALGDPFGRRFDGVPLDVSHGDRLLSLRNASRHALVSEPADRLAAARAAIVRRWTRLFPGGWSSVRGSTASHPLIGLAVRRVPRTTPRCGRASIHDHGYARVDRASGILPVFVQGRVTGCARERRQIAVAVDGRIRAVARTYRLDGEERFSALVPAWSLTRGRHVVAVYGIGADGWLRHMGATGPAPR